MSDFHRRISRFVYAVLSLFILHQAPVDALENGVARTPPMGWNSWNVFKMSINEALFKEIADSLVSTGLAEAGYTYVCIDNGWFDTTGHRANVALPAKFPGGMKSLTDYIHNRGLKAGIYTAWQSLGYEVRDAAAWASWGIDFVKHDAWMTKATDTAAWTNMRDGILATKRPMVYSVHFRDLEKVVIGDPTIMNMWRFTNDLVPFYWRNNQPGLPSWGITTVQIIGDMERVAPHTGPGCWADADMLMVGIGNQTLDEWKTSFAINCLLPSPLIISADIRKSPKELMEIFLNKELIAVNQDTLGSNAWKVRDDGLREVWARRLGDSSFAVVLFNMDLTAFSIQFSWNELKETSGKALVRDLWIKQNVGIVSSSYSVSVPAHGVAFLKVTPERFVTRIGTDWPIRSKTLLPEFVVRSGNGGIMVSLKESPVSPLRMRYTLSTLSGKIISAGQWSIQPGTGGTHSLRVPSGCRTGMYIVSLIADNSTLNVHKEIQAKVFIKD